MNKDLYKEFHEKFPIGKLPEMSLGTYTNNKNGFIHWMLYKFGTSNESNYKGRERINFGIYRYENEQELSAKSDKYDDKFAWKTTKYKIDRNATAEEAFKKIREYICKVAENAHKFALEEKESILQIIDKNPLPNQLKWKIAYLYSDDRLIECYSRDKLLELLKKLVPNDTIKNNISISGLQFKLSKIKRDNYNKFAKAFATLWSDNNNNEDKTMTNSTTSDLAQECAELLKNTKNLILHGAPGTGKTYLAKQIAQQMIFGNVKQELSDEEKKTFNEQVELVQFHPSYDYTDFVEGLRPVNDGGQIGFERKDGVFKKFCEKALQNYLNSKKDDKILQKENDIKDLFSILYDKIENGETTEIKLREGVMDIVGINGKGTAIYLKTRNSNSELKYTISLNRLTKLAEHFKNLKEVLDINNIYEAITNAIKGCHSSGYWGALKTIYEIKETEKSQNPNGKAENKIKEEKKEKNFVFIIDEINRGELSKIFGELFFSIDPEYRGKKGKIRTQYANMQDDEQDHLFDDALGITDSDNFGHFFVPENVYIIGTMNDIDRSVESMDLAMRRRFTFKEITAKNSQKTMLTNRNEKLKDISDDKIEALRNRMNNLNDKIISNEIGLSQDYQIGAAYFLKFADYYDPKEENSEQTAFDNLWEYNLEPLLKEYLRGQGDVENKLQQLEKAYKQGSEQEKPEQNSEAAK